MSVDLATIENAKLNEYTKEEWKDIVLQLKPELTDLEYDKMWSNFQDLKVKYLRKKIIQ
jgi:ribosomal protein L29